MSQSHPRPLWSLIVDGTDITPRVKSRLVMLTLTDNRGFEADQLDLTLDDTDGKLDLPPRGAEIRLSIGWDGGAMFDKGSYTVDEIEHSGAPDQLTIRARSADLRGGLTTQMERSFHDVMLGDVVRTIAKENDLRPMVNFGLAGITIDHLDQTNESSANLLTRMARQYDAIASVKSSRLLFMPAGAGVSASGKPLPAITITRADGDQHRFSLAERDSYTAVKATYYDTHRGTKGEVIWGKEEEDAAQGKRKPVASPQAASLPKLKPLTSIYTSRTKALRASIKAWKALTPKSGWDGIKASYQDTVNKLSGEVSYGREDEARRHKNAVALAGKDAQKISGTDTASAGKSEFDHSADNIKTLRHVYADRDNAQRGARSEYLKLGRGTATFNITLARGRPDLFPDVPVAVRGFKPAIDATAWITSRVTHNISDAGYTTGLELEIRTTEIPG